MGLHNSGSGKVYITGAGPGDPGLITVKAKTALESADLVLYDNLVNPGILDYAPDAEKIYVGKKPYQRATGQDTINEMLHFYALQGKDIVRLKGGDPLIFGRGAEEAQYLMERDIEVEIIPGITSGIAAATYAGIPLTHRDYSQRVVFLTGHSKSGLELQEDFLRAFDGTIVVYMGLKNLEEIARQLTESGKNPETPVAVIENGTLQNQRVVTGCLTDIAGRVAARDFKSPALVVIGDVVALHEKMDWFNPITLLTNQTQA